jgi:hypothetical protein
MQLSNLNQKSLNTAGYSFYPGDDGRKPFLSVYRPGHIVCDHFVNENGKDVVVTESGDKVSFRKIVAWGKLAESLNAKFELGKQVDITQADVRPDYEDSFQRPDGSIVENPLRLILTDANELTGKGKIAKLQATRTRNEE